MANIKSAIKRARITKDENLRNRMDTSALKTSNRRIDESFEAGDKEATEKAYLSAVKTVDQSAAKGIIHKNAANRKKAQLAKKLAESNN
ncbi:MAG: 30S ribosomal protein S20 [Clostridia bacterium]|nr:30S ribosomal protein S20 [Clostridia bacterium]